MKESFKDLKVALIGTGFIGPIHLEALRRLGIQVSGILGSNYEKSLQAAKALATPKAYRDLNELLGDKEIDAVHITSPNERHYDQAKQCIQSGKHVICEKPLSMTVQQAADLVELAKKHDVVTALCHNIRFYPLCQEMSEQIKNKKMGQLFHISGSYSQDWLQKKTDYNWRVNSKQGGELRAVSDIGTHWMDLITFITGHKLEAVMADLQTVHPVRQVSKSNTGTYTLSQELEDLEDISIDTEDAGFILLRFENGVKGCMHVSQVTAGRKNRLSFEIAAEKGSYAWNSENPEQLWVGHRDQQNQMSLRDPCFLSEKAASTSNYPAGHNEGFPDTFKQLFKAIYSKMIQSESSSVEIPSFEDGLTEMLFCEAVLKSHREQRWVSISEIRDI